VKSKNTSDISETYSLIGGPSIRTVRSLAGQFTSNLEIPYDNSPGNYGIRMFEKKIQTCYKTLDQLRDEQQEEEENRKPRHRFTNELGFVYDKSPTNSMVP
jgi:hypothetical protein